MKLIAAASLVAFGASLLILAIAALMWSCAASPSPLEQQKVTDYGAEQMACIARARVLVDEGVSSKAQADQEATVCRDAVKVKYGRRDGGAHD